MSLLRTVYAIKNKNEDIRLASRSGGAFTALSDWILSNGGIVYGCSFDDEFNVIHSRADNAETRNSFRGSKYVQSTIGNTYEQAGNDLKSGLKVLFSGTPCQIDGLNHYLSAKNIDVTNLITVDIICHGVPSPRVWGDFLQTKIIDDKKIESVDFRDKSRFGWRDHIETVVFDDGEVSSTVDYTNLFYSDFILRPSCYNCYYKNINRVSDITIGDYWKIEYNDPEFDDDKGVSIVIVNSARGGYLFDMVKTNFIIKEFFLASSMQTALCRSYKQPNNRSSFWQDYNKMDFNSIVEKYTAPPKKTIKQKIKNIVKKVVKKVIAHG